MNEERPSISANTDMKEMAELSDKEYKVIIKKCFNKQLQIYLKQFFIKIESKK